MLHFCKTSAASKRHFAQYKLHGPSGKSSLHTCNELHNMEARAIFICLLVFSVLNTSMAARLHYLDVLKRTG